MSRFFKNRAAGGFRLDSPVKVPVASEMPRCAPPHTFGAGEEPCQGGVGQKRECPEGLPSAQILDGQAMSQAGGKVVIASTGEAVLQRHSERASDSTRDCLADSFPLLTAGGIILWRYMMS